MSGASNRATATRSISPARLYEMIQSGKAVELIDVRTPAEFRASHATPARLVPLDTLDPRQVVATRTLSDEPIYVICKSGARGEKACAAFAAAGLGDLAVNVEGGTLAWAAAGLPVLKGRYMLPLDRQVQTAVGIVVLLSCVLGWLVSPWWYLLAGYCGCGLIFAGTTGFCPLGTGLARMPWNQETS